MPGAMSGIILIGGGGHCKAVIDAIRSVGFYDICGIVDDNLDLSGRVEGVPVIGQDSDLGSLFSKNIHNAFVAIGSVGDTRVRRQIALRLREFGFILPVLVHASARVPSGVEISQGALIAAGVVIQPGTKIGENAIINTGAIVDHDCTIGDFSHIAPGVVLSGGVVVGKDVHIGTGCAVIENRTIGERAVIGAGSVVVNDIQADCTAFGNPCRPR
jgi:sugar O-acyltransferase (sialic acid O-acetyltransferase NeuD family)